MVETAQQMVGNRGRKAREDLMPFLDAERGESGCAVAGGNEFHLLIETARWWTSCAETLIEEMEAGQASEKKQQGQQGSVSFLEER